MKHWLGNVVLPEAADELFVDGIYPSLRMGDLEAKKMVAKRYIRMILGLCHRFSLSYHDPDELVAEALYGLCEAIDRISHGSLDHHKPKPNVGAYINQTITGILRKVVAGRNPQAPTYKQLLSKDIATKTDNSMAMSRDPSLILQYRELCEVVDQSLKNDREREVLKLRLQGLNSYEIAPIMGITRQRVDQIIASVRATVIQLLQ